VNPQFSRRIVGYKKEESDFLLNFLYDHIAKGLVRWWSGIIVLQHTLHCWIGMTVHEGIWRELHRRLSHRMRRILKTARPLDLSISEGVAGDVTSEQFKRMHM